VSRFSKLTLACAILTTAWTVVMLALTPSWFQYGFGWGLYALLLDAVNIGYSTRVSWRTLNRSRDEDRRQAELDLLRQRVYN